MKTLTLLFILLFSSMHISAQKLDLLVRPSGDSIACKIDSVSLDNIYYQAWINGSPIKNSISKEKVVDYKYGIISRNKIEWQPGTQFFNTKSSTSKPISKNNFYGSAGFFLLYVAADINYERLIKYNPDKFFTSYWLKLSYGAYATWGLEGPLMSATVSTLSGKDKNHFELNFGLSVLIDNWDNSKALLPAGGLGYRFQKPTGGFVFRSGLSFPETVYLSLGYSF